MTPTAPARNPLSAMAALSVADRRAAPRSVARLGRAAGCLGVLGLLAACSGSRNISASQEASRYAADAHRDYAAPGAPSDPWGPYIHEASDRFDVPERWIREVMRVESGGHAELNGRPITSGAGAMGLMQVMPATYDELRGRYDLADDPYDPHNSILAGTAYIRELYDLYGSPGFLAAYNGGPGRLDDYLTRNRPLADETRRYVAKIGPYITDSFPHTRSVAEQYAMNSLPPSIPAGPRYPAAGVTAVAANVTPPRPAAAPAPSPAQSGPVEVAYAPSSDNGGAFDPPPGWTPVRMGRAEVASYVPPPPEPAAPSPHAEMAAAAPAPLLPPDPAPPAAPAASIGLYDQSYQPFTSARAEPAPRLAPARLPEPPRASEVRAPEPRALEPRGSESRTPESRTQVAALPEPPPYVPSSQAASAYAPQTLQHRETGFRLVPTAMAAPAPVYRGSNAQWAIQVGAFGNEGLAHIAVESAREEAAGALAGSRPAVAGIHETHGTLYRARLVGLSRDAAAQACQRLSHKTNCIVLSPEAQN